MVSRILQKSALVLAFSALTLTEITAARAAGEKRKPPAPRIVKRAIVLDFIKDHFIELPNPKDPLRYYGGNIHLELIDQLYRTGDYAIILQSNTPLSSQSSSQSVSTETGVEPDPILVDLTPVASSRISIKLDELSFTTGTGGERMLYGFIRPYSNSYNDGTDEKKRNDFPMQWNTSSPSWFAREFSDTTGDLYTGLELGHEVNFDVMLAGADLKHARYKAVMGANVFYENRVGKAEEDILTVKGKGFYFDFTGHFMFQGIDYLLGISIARRTALYNAFQRIVAAAAGNIANHVRQLPTLGKLAAIRPEGTYINVGANYRIEVGDRFYNLTENEEGLAPAIFQVQKVYQRISLLKKIVDTETRSQQIGDALAYMDPTLINRIPTLQITYADGTRRSVSASTSSQTSSSAPLKTSVASSAVTGVASSGEATITPNWQAITLPDLDIPLPKELEKYDQNAAVRFFKGLKELATLPYRIWRFYQHDQKYEGGEIQIMDLDDAKTLAKKSWALNNIGLTKLWHNADQVKKMRAPVGDSRVVVAVIDSGIDYNHVELSRNIFWDGILNFPGWDFISGDARPYDDHAHGTEVASLIAGGGHEIIGVSPNTTLMALKVFSPYGLTNSGAMYAAFKYALENGARIIVTAWASTVPSEALREAIALAANRNVLVVASSGEHGADLDLQPFYPAAYAKEFDNVVVVAGFGKNGKLLNTPKARSNYGATVNLAAPAENIKVAMPRSNYDVLSNTGLAAGLVAGAAALGASQCLKMDGLALKKYLIESANLIPTLDLQVLDNKALSVDGFIDLINRNCN